MFQKFHEQRETWQVSAATTEEREGGRKQSQACAASSDSITTPVKDPACLPQLSEAQPARERAERERQRDREK